MITVPSTQKEEIFEITVRGEINKIVSLSKLHTVMTPVDYDGMDRHIQCPEKHLKSIQRYEWPHNTATDRPGRAAQLVEHFPHMHETLASVFRTTQNDQVWCRESEPPHPPRDQI